MNNFSVIFMIAITRSDKLSKSLNPANCTKYFAKEVVQYFIFSRDGSNLSLSRLF